VGLLFVMFAYLFTAGWACVLACLVQPIRINQMSVLAYFNQSESARINRNQSNKSEPIRIKHNHSQSITIDQNQSESIKNQSESIRINHQDKPCLLIFHPSPEKTRRGTDETKTTFTRHGFHTQSQNRKTSTCSTEIASVFFWK